MKWRVSSQFWTQKRHLRFPLALPGGDSLWRILRPSCLNLQRAESTAPLLHQVPAPDGYEPPAKRITNTAAVGSVQERERIIRKQQEAIRELSTPVLTVCQRLLRLPIIGVIDPLLARQLTEHLLGGFRTNCGGRACSSAAESRGARHLRPMRPGSPSCSAIP